MFYITIKLTIIITWNIFLKNKTLPMTYQQNIKKICIIFTRTYVYEYIRYIVNIVFN